MKNTLNLSIAGVAFILSEEAYHLLKEYLVRIELGYKQNPDGGEVISDIEARICELILNEQSADKQVSESLIQTIINQLGLPDDLDPTASTSGDASFETLASRLYRSTDNAKLGGVCGGLASYFKVDPIFVRLLFIAPLVLLPFSGGVLSSLFGVSFLLYFILWFVIPKAKTARQKLEMQGDKITASSIRQNIADDFSERSNSPRNEKSASILAELIYVVGRVALFMVKALALFIGGIIAITTISVIIAVIALIAGSNILAMGIWSSLMIEGISATTAIVLLLFTVLIPLFIIGYTMLNVAFKMPPQKSLISILSGIWFLIIIYLGVFALRNIENIKESAESGRLEEAIEKWGEESNWHFINFEHRRYNATDWDYNFGNNSFRFESNKIGDTLRIQQDTINGQMVTDTIHVQYFTK